MVIWSIEAWSNSHGGGLRCSIATSRARCMIARFVRGAIRGFTRGGTVRRFAGCSIIGTLVVLVVVVVLIDISPLAEL